MFYAIQQIYANLLKNQLVGRGTSTPKNIRQIFNQQLSTDDVDTMMGTQAQDVRRFRRLITPAEIALG